MTIQLQHLTLRMGNFRLEINCQLQGTVIGLFGRSGAGKSSLLEIIAGLRRPEQGRIQIDDQVLLDRQQNIFLPAEQRHLGYLPQDLALFPHLTVRQNLEYGFKRAQPLRPALSWAKIIELLEIGPLLDASATQLSGGQGQRVAFARALLSFPRLLLLDEPLASLDQELKDKVLPYLLRIRDELAIPILYVSHSAAEITTLCDQVLVLDSGRVVGLGPPNEFFEPTTTMQLKSKLT